MTTKTPFAIYADHRLELANSRIHQILQGGECMANESKHIYYFIMNDCSLQNLNHDHTYW
jgi:hypothetical protein